MVILLAKLGRQSADNVAKPGGYSEAAGAAVDMMDKMLCDREEDSLIF
jgi:hypothetical protein